MEYLRSITGTLASTVGVKNPLRYRGYYYDVETGLYYLQSRYYDPQTGRFINADDASYIGADGSFVSYNLFAYCNNNPVNNSDPSGYIAIVDDALVWTFIGLCIGVIALVSWMSTPTFRSSWSSFCTAVGNGLSSLANNIANGGKVAWNWTKSKLKSAIKALSTYLAIAKASQKISSKVKKNSKQRYWKADIINKSGYTYVVLGSAISYSQAKARVSAGKSVFTVTKAEARNLARNFGGVVGPEIGRKSLGQYWHYHVNNRKNKAHIFYMF